MARISNVSATDRSWSRLDVDRRVGAVRQHVDVVHLHDEPGVGILLRFRHNLGKFRIIAPRLEALVAFFS